MNYKYFFEIFQRILSTLIKYNSLNELIKKNYLSKIFIVLMNSNYHKMFNINE